MTFVSELIFILAAPAAMAQDKPHIVYAPPSDVHSVHVPYADLNLSSSQGVRQLTYRVSGAVRQVCRFERGFTGFGDYGYDRCSDGAWDGARPQMNQAISRAREIASTGRSSIPAAAIVITIK